MGEEIQQAQDPEELSGDLIMEGCPGSFTVHVTSKFFSWKADPRAILLSSRYKT